MSATKTSVTKLERSVYAPSPRPLAIERITVWEDADGNLSAKDEAKIAAAEKRREQLEQKGYDARLIVERVVCDRHQEPATPTTDNTSSGPATDSVSLPSSGPAAGPTTDEPEPPAPAKPTEYDEQLAKAQRGLSFGRWRW